MEFLSISKLTSLHCDLAKGMISLVHFYWQLLSYGA